MATKIVSAAALLSVSILVSVCRSQRPPFAGTRPIGYPEMSTEAPVLADRFGEGDGTTQPLPIEALGDRDLVNRLNKLPIDKQPFWFINWQALQKNRENPKVYPQSTNSFVNINTNTDQNVGTSAQNETANRFGNAENSGSPNTSGSTVSSQKVGSSGTNESNGNLGNVNGSSGSLSTIKGVTLNETSGTSDVSNTNTDNIQNDKNVKGMAKKNNHTY